MPDNDNTEFANTAKQSTDAGIADETAGYSEAIALDEEADAAGDTATDKQIPTEGGTDEDESAAQPS